MSALSLVQACVHRDGRLVLDAADLAVSSGEVVGVVGANGAGKTTLLRAALGLVPLQSGMAELAGSDVRSLNDAQRAERAAYLPQERHIGWNMTAGRIASLGAFKLPPAAARAAASRALARVGMANCEDRGVLDLSGGERARVLLARLLATEAPLLVADEPIAGLDPDAQLLALDLFRDEATRGAGVLLTLHDLNLAARFCDRVVVLSSGRVIAEGPATQALSRDVLIAAFNLEGNWEVTASGPRLVAQRKSNT